MNGVDYSKQLDRTRRNYQNDMSQAKKNHQEELNDVKSSSQAKIDKQLTAHKADRDRTEKDYAERVQTLDKSQRDALVQKSDTYNKALEQNKADFHDERRDNLRGWNQKITDLKDSFKRNLNEKETTDTEIRKQLKGNYSKNVDRIRSDASNDLKEYQANAIGDNKELAGKMSIERKQLNTIHQKEKNEILKREIDKRNLLKGRALKDIAKMREFQESNSILNREKSQENFKKLVHDTDEKVASVRKNFSKELDRLSDSQSSETKKQNAAFSDRYAEQEKRYNHNLRELEFRNKVNGIGAGSVNEQLQAKANENKERQTEMKNEVLIDERSKLMADFEDKNEKAVQNFQDNYRDMKIDFSKDITDTRKELTEANRDAKFKDRLEREEISHNNTLARKQEQETHDKQLQHERVQAHTRVNNLKDSFSNSLTELKEKNESQFDDVKKELGREKVQMAQALNEQNAHQSSNLKENYDQKLDKLSRGYEQRIKSLENQNRSIQEASNNKVSHLMNSTQIEIERQQKLYKETARNGINKERSVASERERQLRSQIVDIKASFDEKMDTQRLTNQKKLKNLQFTAEQDKVSESRKYQKIIDQNNKFFDREMARVKLASENERERLVTQYEEKLTQMQKIHRDKQEEIEHFNKLNNA